MSEKRSLFDFESFDKRPAFISDLGEIVSHADLKELSDELAACYDSLASEIGTRPLTMMLCENTVSAYCLYIGLLQGNWPVMLISAALHEDMCRQILNSYKPALLALPKSLRGRYPSMMEWKPVSEYCILRTNFTENFPVHPDLCVLVTTSGSTGSVRFVRQSSANIRFDAEAVANYLDITKDERMITTMALTYTYTQSMTRATLLRGGSVVVTGFGIMDDEFWNLMEKEKVTTLHGVSNIYEMMQRLDLFSEEMPYLKTMTQGGGKLSKDLHLFLARFSRQTGRRFCPTYGLSEATASITYLSQELCEKKPGSVGRPYPGGSCRLLDISNKQGSPAIIEITTPHTPGELEYRSQSVCMGYAECGEDLAKEDEWNGVVQTGDIAEMDEDGDLYIVGRLKRFIKVSGLRISLDEIDTRIMDALNIISVSVGADEHPVICLTKTDDVPIVKSYIREKIPVLRSVARYVVVDEIPRNESGKIRFGELQKKVETVE